MPGIRKTENIKFKEMILHKSFHFIVQNYYPDGNAFMSKNYSISENETKPKTGGI